MLESQAAFLFSLYYSLIDIINQQAVCNINPGAHAISKKWYGNFHKIYKQKSCHIPGPLNDWNIGLIECRGFKYTRERGGLPPCLFSHRLLTTICCILLQGIMLPPGGTSLAKQFAHIFKKNRRFDWLLKNRFYVHYLRRNFINLRLKSQGG